jgi:hypothetical protein
MVVSNIYRAHHVHRSQTDMGPCSSKRCQRRVTPIFREGYGGPHKTQISVCVWCHLLWSYSDSTPLSQPGQTSVSEVQKRDLRAELIIAEQEARNKKRKAEGKPPLAIEVDAPADDESNKRRKLLQEALDLDKDDDDDNDEQDMNEQTNGEKNEDEDGDRYAFEGF